MKAIKMKTMEEILDVISENVSRIEFTKIYDGKGKIIFDLNTDLKKPENANEIIENFCKKNSYIKLLTNKNVPIYINPEQVHAVEVENYWYDIWDKKFFQSRITVAFKKEKYLFEFFLDKHFNVYEEINKKMREFPYIFTKKELELTVVFSKLKHFSIKINNDEKYSIRRLTTSREDFQNIIHESEKNVVYYIEIPESKLYVTDTGMAVFKKCINGKLAGHEIIEAAYVIEN